MISLRWRTVAAILFTATASLLVSKFTEAAATEQDVTEEETCASSATCSSARTKTLVFGAAGAIGTNLVRALVERDGPRSVVAALRRTPLPTSVVRAPDGSELVAIELGIDLRNGTSVSTIVSKYADSIKAIWNLAAPLSVETESDPDAAEDIVVRGMTRLVEAMELANLPSTTRLLFSDSIGSFGKTAPRVGADAVWLTNNPTQDPGSEYGRQKRRCREILAKSKFDSRWAVIPGVLHDLESWGDGTTEYALDMLKAFHERRTPFECPVKKDSKLPMIHMDDLIDGLLALENAEMSKLSEPEGGYAMAGFSFAPSDLESHLQGRTESWGVEDRWYVTYDGATGPAASFAELWPDTISAEAASRDLGWKASRVPDMERAVDQILKSHADRAK